MNMAIQYTDLGFQSRIRGGENFDDRLAKENDVELEKLKDYFEKKKGFVLSFSKVDDNGNLTAFNKNGFKYYMPNSEVTENESYSTRFRMAKLTYSYEVVITNIDYDKKVITVSHKQIRNTQKDRLLRKLKSVLGSQNDERKKLTELAEQKVNEYFKDNDNMKDIVSGLQGKTRNRLKNQLVHNEVCRLLDESGVKRLVVPVLVRKVIRDAAYVDVMGYGIPGYLPKYYFAHTHIDDLQTVCKNGDIVDVEIIGYAEKKEGRGMFLCARTPLIQNPWAEENFAFKEGDFVKVTCVAIKGNRWFGEIEGMEIQVLCEFPPESAGYRVELGEEYDCRIYRVRIETKLMRARPIRHVVNRRKE